MTRLTSLLSASCANSGRPAPRYSRIAATTVSARVVVTMARSRRWRWLPDEADARRVEQVPIEARGMKDGADPLCQVNSAAGRGLGATAAPQAMGRLRHDEEAPVRNRLAATRAHPVRA